MLPFLLQGQSSPVQPPLYRGNGQAQSRGYFTLRKALAVAQQQRQPQLFGQPVQRVRQRRVGRRAGGDLPLQLIGGLHAHALSLHVAAFVHHNAHQPGPEALRLHPRSGGPGVHQGLLHRVLGVVDLPQEGEAHPVEGGGHLPHLLHERSVAYQGKILLDSRAARRRRAAANPFFEKSHGAFHLY